MSAVVNGWFNPENTDDQVTGVVAGFTSREGRFGTVPVMVLTTPEGDVSVAMGRSVLRGSFKQSGAQVGDEITIIFHGKAPGKSYYLYTVRCPAREASMPASQPDTLSPVPTW